MTEDHVKITLIGRSLAVPGEEFIYCGPVAECEGCKVYKVCTNLRRNVRYVICGIRSSATQQCSVHPDGVCAVEVDASTFPALLAAERAIVNSHITADLSCPNKECPHHSLCHPEGLIPGERYLVEEAEEGVPVVCEMGKKLRRVFLTPVDY